MRRLLIPFLAVFLTSSLQAAVFLEMDSTKLLKCTLSHKHHNRIVVEGQRIKKALYSEGKVLIRTEEASGQLFVQALVGYPSALTVSIITEEGCVQDVEIDFENKSSEILILKDKNLSASSDSFVCVDDDKGLIQNVIEKMMAGNIPEEYVPVEDRQICCQIKYKVNSMSVMRLIGPVYTIYVFKIENNSYRSACIHEQDVNCVNGEWIFIERNTLKHDEKMMALVGVRTYEQ